VAARSRIPSPGPRARPGTLGRAALWAGAVLALAGCTSAASVPTTSTTPPTTSTTTTVPPTTTTTTEQPGWTVASRVQGSIAVDSEAVTEPSGHVVTIYRFRVGLTRFGLHVGTTDPPRGAAVVTADSGAAVGPDEAPLLLAAFNGGFESSTGVGGFELNGQTLVPLRSGLASLVIDTSGVGHVGIWGQGVPVPGETVASVRQNLAPLVAAGAPSPGIGSVSAWGATLGGGASVARSALGEDASGDLLYAGSMSAVPSELAAAMVGAGTVSAMELDINPEWVQLAVAPAPGAPLTTGVPGQNRPASQYTSGWTRDFVTVLAAS
jgi:hypothetical protein